MTDSSSPADGEHTENSEFTESEGGGDDAEQATPPRYHPPPQQGFDWRGWILVAVLFVSLLVVPGAILYLPHAQDFIAWIGVSWRQAYLALPMIPAILLGGTAIWAAVNSRRDSE